MNTLEKKMVDSLLDLRHNHHVLGVKAEFEAEGTRLEEAMRLKEVVTKAGLELTIKIGGCEAVKDMYDARLIGTGTIVAPMIETPYAMKKYVNAVKFVFSGEERKNMKFLINLETVTGFQNLEAITAAEDFKYIDGIVLGRVDLCRSLGYTREEINTEEIFSYALKLSEAMKAAGRDFVIGGGVSVYSMPFFRRLPYLTRFETRKIIFDATGMCADPHPEKGILKAVGFELMWLENKRSLYHTIFEEDAQRMEMLERRYRKLIDEAGRS